MAHQNNTKPQSRLFHLDNLRIYLTILVIVHHTAIAYGGAGDWAIIDIGLLPAHQNRGIGTYVLSEHLRQAVQAGVAVRLHVLCENHAAQRLYERHGFVISGQTGIHFEMAFKPNE